MTPSSDLPFTMATDQSQPCDDHDDPRPSTDHFPDHSDKSQSSATLHHNQSPPQHECKPDRSRPKMSRLEHACLNLSPSFFSLNMGTGIASILLYNLPYNATWLQRIGIVIFVLNILLFVIISSLSIVRYIRWKGIFSALQTHCMAGLYWGCLPMGFVTIIVSSLEHSHCNY